jgi:molybdate transport system ATP-binding protein
VNPQALKVWARKRRGDFVLDARFELPLPGIVGLFGRSGCGKSTLVNVLAGLLRADAALIDFAGEILIDTARRIELAAEERRIGYVFQDARLFPHLDVAGNLRYGQRRARIAPYVSLETVAMLLGLEPLLARRTHELSGGERQRVAIGRALLTQPRLLLLDEPLASLDAARREEVLPYLETLRDRLRVPMVYVSHHFEEVVRLATHLVLMDAGRVVAQGGLNEMSLRPELRTIVGPEAAGVVVDGRIVCAEPDTEWSQIAIGSGTLTVTAPHHAVGATLRVQILARDVIVAAQPPQRLSVRNVLKGTVTAITADSPEADLIFIDLGGQIIIARIANSATRELRLQQGMPVWALVKAVALRGHALGSPVAADGNRPGFPG